MSQISDSSPLPRSKKNEPSAVKLSPPSPPSSVASSLWFSSLYFWHSFLVHRSRRHLDPVEPSYSPHLKSCLRAWYYFRAVWSFVILNWCGSYLFIRRRSNGVTNLVCLILLILSSLTMLGFVSWIHVDCIQEQKWAHLGRFQLCTLSAQFLDGSWMLYRRGRVSILSILERLLFLTQDIYYTQFWLFSSAHCS